MHFLVSRSIHLLLFSSLLLLSQNPISAEEPIFTVCPLDTSNFTSGSQFETNLNRLLPLLSPNGPSNLTGYYNTTYGNDPNIVYGYSQCMSGATAEQCNECLRNSTVEIIRRCSNRMEAVIRYYRCILRYSYRPFFSQSDSGIQMTIVFTQDATNITAFNQKLGSLMRGLTSEAASKESKFTTGNTNMNDFQDIYGLAQCTRDLSVGDCTTCLQQMVGEIPNCCANRVGGNVYSVSCNIRYETYPFFYNSPETSPPPPIAAPPPPSQPPGTTDGGKKKDSKKAIIIVVAVIISLLIIGAICTCLWMRRKVMRRKPVLQVQDREEISITAEESLLFDLDTLKAATDNFSDANKLGQGGFGAVYKGKLYDGREIAVKRLSRTSVQGMEELKNEVALVAKLQHRNLVRLWGCCMEQQEKLLVYEYVRNTSLDTFLFDPIKRLQLDWVTRYKIISGIARGLLYLHEDSRLRIIHRDLKAGNILLDGSMNPKIADFGMAKLFGADQTQGNTSRIAGTYGYMAPEYAMHGQFSTKSDVFSFGVLVLEIVTGQKNIPFHDAGNITDLLTYAWQHWIDGAALDIMDQTLAEQCSRSEIFRCIHMGLLCSQEDATERPTMSSVVLMLNSQSMTLPAPSPPAFLVGSRMNSASISGASNSTTSGSDQYNR